MTRCGEHAVGPATGNAASAPVGAREQRDVARRPLAALLACASVVLLSCSFDYAAASLEEELRTEIADTTLTNVRHTVVENGAVNVIVNADRLESYVSSKTTVLTGIHYREIDRDGATMVEGWADRAVYDLETENAEVSGQVVFQSHADDLIIAAERLDWERETRRLSAPRDARVVVTKSDGTYIEGTGFFADFRISVVRFDGPTTGVLVVEDEQVDESTGSSDGADD